MPLFTIIFKKGSPSIDGKELLAKIEKWFIEPNPYEMTTREMTVAKEKQDFLKLLPGAKDFLVSLKNDVSESVSANPINKKKLLEAQDNFKALNNLFNDYTTKQGDLRRLKNSTAMNNKGNSSVQITPELQDLFDRFKKLTGHEAVAEITSKHFKYE